MRERGREGRREREGGGREIEGEREGGGREREGGGREAEGEKAGERRRQLIYFLGFNEYSRIILPVFSQK